VQDGHSTRVDRVGRIELGTSTDGGHMVNDLSQARSPYFQPEWR